MSLLLISFSGNTLLQKILNMCHNLSFINNLFLYSSLPFCNTASLILSCFVTFLVSSYISLLYLLLLFPNLSYFWYTSFEICAWNGQNRLRPTTIWFYVNWCRYAQCSAINLFISFSYHESFRILTSVTRTRKYWLNYDELWLLDFFCFIMVFVISKKLQVLLIHPLSCVGFPPWWEK